MNNRRPAPRSRAPRVPEKAEQQQIVHALRAVGARVYVLGTRRRAGDYPGTMQTPGIPDLVAFVPLRHAGAWRQLWIEVKAEGGRVSPEQHDFATHCAAASQAHVFGGLNAVYAWLLEQGVVKPDQIPHYRLPHGAAHV